MLEVVLALPPARGLLLPLLHPANASAIPAVIATNTRRRRTPPSRGRPILSLVGGRLTTTRRLHRTRPTVTGIDPTIAAEHRVTAHGGLIADLATAPNGSGRRFVASPQARHFPRATPA